LTAVHLAKGRGLTALEASKEVIQAFTHDPTAESFLLHGVRIFETGKREEIEDRESRTMDEVNHGRR